MSSRNLRVSREDSAASCSEASTDLGSSGGGLNSRDAPHNHAVAKMIANNPLPSGSFHEFTPGLASVTLRVIFVPKIPNRFGASTMVAPVQKLQSHGYFPTTCTSDDPLGGRVGSHDHRLVDRGVEFLRQLRILRGVVPLEAHVVP